MYKQLDLFRARLPDRPYCTNDFHYGLAIKMAQEAIRRRYIQPNYPWLKTWLVYDIDRPGGGHDWQWLNACPPPNIVAENPENKHAHLFYGLEIPVAVNTDSTKAAKYAAAIQYALLKLLDADPGYTGFTAKNPLHEYWQVSVHQQIAYTLDWLADYVDLDKFDAREKSPDYGIGRNCTLFDHLRRYAYRAVKQYWRDRRYGYQAFYDDLEVKAAFQNNNLFGVDNCLFFPEVQHIIKSVAGWTWKNFTPEAFAARQKARSLKAAMKRQAEADKRRQQLLAFMQENPGATQAAAAHHIGVNRTTVYRALKGVQSPISERGDVASPISRERAFPAPESEAKRNAHSPAALTLEVEPVSEYREKIGGPYG